MCGQANQCAGPRGHGFILIRRDSCWPSRSALREMLIAFKAQETLPASKARSLEYGFQLKTSGVPDSWWSAFTYLSASTVPFELIVTLPRASCTDAPNDPSQL